MNSIIGLVAIAASSLSLFGGSTDSKDIEIRFMRPSRMIELMKGLEPGGETAAVGLTFTADDETGILKVKGKPDDVDQIEAFIAIFDVKPRKIELDIEVNSPIDCDSNHVVAESANNTPFTFTDAGIGIQITFSTRINEGDNTVTMFLSSKYEDATTSLVARLKNNEALRIRLGKDGKVFISPDEESSEKRSHPIIKVTPRLMDMKSKASINPSQKP